MNMRSQIFTRTVWADSKNKGECFPFINKWAVCFSFLLLAGCSGVCIVDAERSVVCIRRDSGSFREEPLYVKDNGYVTLQRSETNSYILRSINFAGEETNRREMPLFLTGYGGDEYAFSDEGKMFAYVEFIGAGPIERLRVASTLSPKDNVLPVSVCDNLRAALGYSVFWISPTRILLYAKNPMPYHEPEKREDIFILDLDGMRVARLPGYDNYWCGPILLSPSKRYLLASEEIIDTHLYRLHIVDLNAEKEIFVIAPTGDDMDAHGAVWSSDDEVVYAVDGVVYTQKVGLPDKREIFRLPPKRGVWLYAVDSAHGLHYQMFDTRSRPAKKIGGWRVHNLDTHDDKELTGEQITGRVLMNSKRDKIVAAVGY